MVVAIIRRKLYKDDLEGKLDKFEHYFEASVT
jgi:hypothetical protein